MRRGFVFTVYALLFFSLLFSYSIGWLSFSADQLVDFSNSDNQVVSGLLDNVSSAYSTVYPYHVWVEDANSRWGVSGRFLDYNAQVLGALSDAFEAYAQEIPALSFSLSASDGQNSQELLLSSGVSFNRVPHDANTEWVFLDEGLGPSFVRLDENVRVTNVDLNHTSPWSWNPSGDVVVHFLYKDDSVTLPLFGRLDSSQFNDYVFYFTTGSALHVQLYRLGDGTLVVQTVADSAVAGDFNAIFTSDSNRLFQIRFPATVSVSYANTVVETHLPYSISPH